MNSPGSQGTCRPNGPGPDTLQIDSRNQFNSHGYGTRSWAVSILTSSAFQTRSDWLRPLQSWWDCTVEVFSQHPASNHFNQAGDYTRFCDCNFIHRARLGCLQLNATMRFSKRNSCRFLSD
ncbi:hypothetical protein NPIL_367311 [Nephila pilipes]|uniref:Uncharacterized protein n=1 Tax=Nephila pilipes TaxID=299642 RepID=A0A8X6T8C7_NEPPI|nr:hypothetical protein NPIL_367311 [Nephila pilipes]